MSNIPTKRLVQAGFGLGILIVSSTNALAATIAQNFNVSATVSAACTFEAFPLDFGIYNGVTLDATTTVKVGCSSGTPYDIGLNEGIGVGATTLNRYMSTLDGVLLYGLFQDAARTLNWGNTVGTDTVSGTGDGIQHDITVYGRILGNQLPTTGSYLDTITATLTF